jgi:FKBP12-rapamycin complex-associated protein
MLERVTGKVIHIDFGDCFEVAMHRDKFPEKIPFRLTRMLVSAMEISGIEGSFRTTCEDVMRVLRENKESLMAVLEAFVHDPLINWRLLRNLSNQPQQNAQQDKNSKNNVSDIDAEFLEETDTSRSLASRKLQNNEMEILAENEGKFHFHSLNSLDAANKPEVLNARAVAIVNRVSNKLSGRDFKPNNNLDVPTQVDKLIQQAMAVENLCQCYIGWCPFVSVF